MLDAHQLNIFLTAAETLNFTKAAEQLHMSQPSVSQHIRALEKHFDTKLFLRQGRSLSLSEAGKTLIPLARQFVRQSTCIDETMSSLKGQIRGKICLACNAPAGKYVLPEYFARFHMRYPEVTIECLPEDCQQPFEELNKGTIHFAITNLANGRTPNTDFHTFLTEDITLITNPDHPWTGRDAVSLEELQAEKYILPNPGSQTFQTINAHLLERGIGLSQLDAFLSLSTSEAVIISVAKGLGVGFSSRLIADQIAEVAYIPIKGLAIKRDMSISRNSNQPATAARNAFWDFMTSIQLDLTS